VNKIEVKITASRPIFIDADADSFGMVFANMSDEEQVAVFRAMVEHMRPHKMQWDYISIELEKPENLELRSDLSVLFPDIRSLEEKNEKLRSALTKAADQLHLVHHDAFRQAGGYGLVSTDGRAFSCTELNKCEVASHEARAVLKEGAA
jgi:hypothetical protein